MVRYRKLAIGAVLVALIGLFAVAKPASGTSGHPRPLNSRRTPLAAIPEPPYVSMGALLAMGGAALVRTRRQAPAAL